MQRDMGGLNGLARLWAKAALGQRKVGQPIDVVSAAERGVVVWPAAVPCRSSEHGISKLAVFGKYLSLAAVHGPIPDGAGR